MTRRVEIKEQIQDHEILSKGDYAVDSEGGVYLITKVNESTFNVMPFKNARFYECIPKSSLKPFYGTITITIER